MLEAQQQKQGQPDRGARVEKLLTLLTVSVMNMTKAVQGAPSSSDPNPEDFLNDLGFMDEH
jgi:hypothetical protein